MNTTTVEQSISDLYHNLALKAGLKHTGGRGSQSVFEGDHEAWGRLDAALALYPRSASVTAARRRCEWAMG